MKSGERSTRAKPLFASILAAASLLAATAVLKGFELNAPLRLVVALLPVPAYAFFLIAQVNSLRRLDEMQQRIQLEALVIAFPTTFVAILTTWLLRIGGFLPGLGFTDAVVFFLLFMIFIYPLGRMIAASRYQ